jgi:hypothetical protein
MPRPLSTTSLSKRGNVKENSSCGHGDVQGLCGFWLAFTHSCSNWSIQYKWDISEWDGRHLKETQARLGKLVGNDINKQVLITYTNKCRQLISQTHSSGRCEYLKDQLATKGILHKWWASEGFLESFQAVKSIPVDAWTQGHPDFLNANEYSIWSVVVQIIIQHKDIVVIFDVVYSKLGTEDPPNSYLIIAANEDQVGLLTTIQN